jgi:hypothetical protein
MEPLNYVADETIYCDEAGLHFNSYVPEIPKDVVINKTIPGFGATYTEIKAERNSIIVLPNVATIISKQGYHGESDGTYAVFENISTANIVSYLKSSIKFKKFLTTPESLKKILRAFFQLGVNAYSTYFILLDESHKLIQDVDYRPSITRALEQFFKFDNKAMISATPIMPSDPRLQTFKYIKLQPTFNYSRPVELLYNNDVIYALTDSFDRCPHVKHCIFFNSVNGIASLIKQIGIGEESMVFCSKESAEYLRSQTFGDTGETIGADYRFDPKLMKKYTFFTSSLYNGLDIILDEAPQVIMISLANDPKTWLDPYTDVLQILGRFRVQGVNKTGIYAEAIHLISNYSTGQYKTKKEVTAWLLANQSVYDSILTLLYSALNPEHKAVYKDALKRLPFHSFLANEYHFHRNNPSTPNHPSQENPDKYMLDYFKIDNLYETERVNSYYGNGIFLWEAYKNAGVVSKFPELKSFTLYLNERLTLEKVKSKVNTRGSKRYSKANVRRVTKALYNLEPYREEQGYEEAVYQLTLLFPIVKQAYFKLGWQQIAIMDYSIGSIKQALIDYYKGTGQTLTPVIDSIYSRFFLNVKIPVTTVKKNIQAVYDHYELEANAKATDVYQWFKVKETKIVTYKRKQADGLIPPRTEQRAFILLERIYNYDKDFKAGGHFS